MSVNLADLIVAGRNFRPGEEICGEVSWACPTPPRTVEVRLFWHTKGRGDRDSATIWESSFEGPLAEDRRTFSLSAPRFPSSFSGKLISLMWTMELVIDGNGTQIAELVIAPAGIEIDLRREEWLAMDAPREKKNNGFAPL